MKQPNIIYILGDDHRQDFLSMEQHPFLQTPNLAQLAADGIYFENSFCTSPVCTPSRACHYTGCWERAHGINFNSKSAMSRSAWENTFPVILRNHGYQTAWVGKNHVPVGEKSYKTGAMEQTFDYWYGNHGHSKFYPKETAGSGGIYDNAAADTQIEIFEEGAMNFLDPQPEFIESCTSPLIYRDPAKPFCMCITFNLPHDCSTETMEQRPSDDEIYKNLYRDHKDDIQPPKTYIAAADITTPRLPKAVYSGEYIKSYDYVRTLPALQERIVRICQTVTGMDRMIGHLRETLEALGIAENTIIIFSTDHGIHHGEHGLGGKCFLYQEDLRIPLVIYDPRKPGKGKRLRQMVAVPDLAPTVLALAGIDAPDCMQGDSLLPLLRGEDVPWRTELFAEQLMDTQNYPKSEAVCTPEWKYIRYFARTDDPRLASYRIKSSVDDYYAFLESSPAGGQTVVYEELYHLAQDPYEEENLASVPERAETLAYFRGRVQQMAAERLVPDTAQRVCKNTNEVYIFEEEKGYYPVM